jgi:hypothetical protein
MNKGFYLFCLLRFSKIYQIFSSFLKIIFSFSKIGALVLFISVLFVQKAKMSLLTLKNVRLVSYDKHFMTDIFSVLQGQRTLETIHCTL